MSDLIGQSLGNYQITSVIGEGGMGTVYLGEHRTLRRKAAVKVLKRQYAADANMVKRFVEEARVASAVAHPNIVEIHDVGTLADGLPFMLMEYLPGESLGRRLSRVRRLTAIEARAIMLQAASALEAVHDRGVVHRDLKPDNLFLIPDPLLPGGEKVKVLDFGVAKLRGDLSSGGVHTRSGTLLGTPQYMAPEQCRGLSDEIDARTDIYALGVILYEMMCGEPPFTAPSFGDLVVLHITTPPPRPTSKVADIPPEMERAILRALKKLPDDRFQTMADFRRALGTTSVDTLVRVTERALPAVSARPTPTNTTTLSGTAGETLRVSPYRRPSFVVGSAAAVVAVVGVLALSLRSEPLIDPGRKARVIAPAPPAPGSRPPAAPPEAASKAAASPAALPSTAAAPEAVPALQPSPPEATAGSPTDPSTGSAGSPTDLSPASVRRRRRLAGQPALVSAGPDGGALPAADVPAVPPALAAPVEPTAPPPPPKPRSEKW